MGSSNDGAVEMRSLALPLLRVPATAATNSPPRPPTPPLQTSAAVPFRWEEKPGVPRRFTLGAVMQLDQLQQPPKCLELPPCRVFPLTPSPTSVLDGPRAVGRPKFSSFRLLRYSLESGGNSSRGSPALGGDNVQVFPTVGEQKELGDDGLDDLKARKKNGGASFRFLSPSNSSWESDEIILENKQLRSKGSFCSIPYPRPRHLLGSIRRGLKQVIQWKSSRNPKRENK